MEAAVPRTATNTCGDVRLAPSLVGFAAFALLCQRKPIDSGKADHADALSSCQRAAARLLHTFLYTCLLICLETVGAVGAFTLSYTVILFAAQAHSLPHGPLCRLATVVASTLPVVVLWEIPLGLCVSIIVASLPSPWLWWPPKKSDEKIMEDLVEIEQWVKANLDELRSRGDDCLRLRQLEREERRFYWILLRDKTRIEANAALTEQLAKLHRMVAEGMENAEGNYDDPDAAGGVKNEGGEVEELQKGSSTTATAQPSEHVEPETIKEAETIEGRDPNKHLEEKQKEIKKLAAAEKYAEAASLQAEITKMQEFRSTENAQKTDPGKAAGSATKCGECHANRQSLPPQRTLRAEKSHPEAPAKKQNKVDDGAGKGHSTGSQMRVPVASSPGLQ